MFIRNNASLVQSVKIVPSSSALEKKMAHIKFAIAAIGLSLWSVINGILIWPIVARAFSYFYHRDFFEDIEQAQIQKLTESLRIAIDGKQLGTVIAPGREGRAIHSFSKDELKANLIREIADEVGAEKLAKDVIAIRDHIDRLRNGKRALGEIASLRNKIVKAMKRPIFQKLASNPNCYAVNFLQVVAVKLIATDASDVLRKYGKKCLGEKLFENQPKRTFRPNELADQISGYLEKPSFNADRLCFPIKESRLVWAAAHPILAMNAAYSCTHPLSYNASAFNPYFSSHTFKEGKKEVVVYYGPNPTGDVLFQYGVLPAYAKFGTFELRFSYQNTHNPCDHHRITNALSMVNENHHHAVISFDKKWMGNFDSVETFFTSYRNYVREGIREIHDSKTDSGFYIPEALYSDAQIHLALRRAEEFCKTLSTNNPYWQKAMKDESGKKRMAKVMMLITDTFLTLGMTCRAFDRITPAMIQNSLNKKLDQDLMSIRTSGACKQTVDRAVVQNISLRLFFRWTTNPAPLTANEVCEIAGTVFGRARIVDDRNIQKHRYLILDDFLRFIGACPNGSGVASAHAILSKYRKELN